MIYNDLLDSYVSAVIELEKKVLPIDEKTLLHKPFDGAWSIKQHIVHIAETDINNFIRWRSVIGSPGSKVFVIDEDAWAENLNYDAEDIESYLSVMKTLRIMTRDYLSKQDEKVFTENYFIREYKGKSDNFTIEMCLSFFNRHIDMHCEYIDRNIRSVLEQM